MEGLPMPAATPQLAAAQALSKTGEGIKKLFSNKKFVFWFFAILIIVILWRSQGWRIKNVWKKKDIDLEIGETQGVDEFRKSIIESTAREIYNDIESTGWFGHEYGAYEIAYDFTDNELKYLYNYYKTQFGQSIIKAMDSQWYNTSSIPRKLTTKLKAIGFN